MYEPYVSWKSGSFAALAKDLVFCLMERQKEKMGLSSVALQVLPKVPEDRLFAVVDKVIEYIASTGVNYVVGPFETTMEGEFDLLMDIVKRSQEICAENGAAGVMSYVKIAYSAPEGKDTYTIEEKTGKYNGSGSK